MPVTRRQPTDTLSDKQLGPKEQVLDDTTVESVHVSANNPSTDKERNLVYTIRVNRKNVDYNKLCLLPSSYGCESSESLTRLDVLDLSEQSANRKWNVLNVMKRAERSGNLPAIDSLTEPGILASSQIKTLYRRDPSLPSFVIPIIAVIAALAFLGIILRVANETCKNAGESSDRNRNRRELENWDRERERRRGRNLPSSSNCEGSDRTTTTNERSSVPVAAGTAPTTVPDVAMLMQHISYLEAQVTNMRQQQGTHPQDEGSEYGNHPLPPLPSLPLGSELRPVTEPQTSGGGGGDELFPAPIVRRDEPSVPAEGPPPSYREVATPIPRK